MFWRHEIRVPAAFEAVVDSEISARRPLYVGRHDQVHFVSFAPALVSVSAEATSREGIAFEWKADVRIEIPRDNLGELLRDSGYSTYRKIVYVSAEGVSERQNLPKLIEGSIQNSMGVGGFLDLADGEQARATLNEKVQQECSRARLGGELISVEFYPKQPDPELLAILGARALHQPSLEPIVQHFREVGRQRHELDAEDQRAKKVSIEARADGKIVESAEDDRVLAHQAELQKAEAERQREAQKRNAAIKEISAQYEFAYRAKRLEEEKQLAEKEVEVAMAKEAETASLREQKKLDLELELNRQKSLATIRSDERQRTLAEIGAILEKANALPQPNYEGVRTLVTNGPDSRDQVTAFLWKLLTKLDEGFVAGEDGGGEEQFGPAES